MEMKQKKGYKSENDYLVFIEDDGERPFRIIKLLATIRALDLNEQRIRKDKGYNIDLFYGAVKDCIDGVPLAEICEKWHLKRDIKTAKELDEKLKNIGFEVFIK